MVEPIDSGRRSFLGWSLRLGAPLVLGGLGSCGGSDDGGDGPAAPAAPAAGDGIEVLRQPASVAITVAPRRVQWVPGKDPASINAWVYARSDGDAVLPNHLGPVFEVRRGVPCVVTWRNALPAAAGDPLVLDEPPTKLPPSFAVCGTVRLQSPVGVTTHLHGARVEAASDGWPLAPIGYDGNPYGLPTAREFTYPNAQRSTMLWYHDHALDRTARNVHAGLAGVYYIRDAADDEVLALVGGPEYELTCVLQDRIVSDDGTAIDYAGGTIVGVSDEAGGRPEFLGTTVFVNGHPAGSATLQRRTYRLRVLNASNARTFALALCDADAIGLAGRRIWYTHLLRVIGADGGLVSRSVALNDTQALVLAPAQRRDLLVDLGALPAGVTRLRLVNLALKLLAASTTRIPEAIFMSPSESLLLPTSPDDTAMDLLLYGALTSPLSQVMTVGFDTAAATPAPAVDAVDAVLASAASEADFVWDGRRLAAPAGAALGPNRLVLMVSNTAAFTETETANGIDGWRELQLFELGASGSDWQLPFAVDLGTPVDPPAGGPSAVPQGYALARRSFFVAASNPDIRTTKSYPALHEPVVVARAGTWERWYVANIGNSQPLRGDDPGPELHPFHIHLVNVVVTRRWQLDGQAEGGFVEVVSSALELNGIARQDTVQVPPGQMVELLVHYPAGYSGDYVFHCHLLEHEDVCMMSHYRITA